LISRLVDAYIGRNEFEFRAIAAVTREALHSPKKGGDTRDADEPKERE